MKENRYNWQSAGYLGWPFPVLKYYCIFQTTIYGSNFVEQHSKTVTIRNYQNSDCGARKKISRNLLQFSPHFRCLEPTRQSQDDKPERMRKCVIFSASDGSIADKWSIDTADSQSGTCPAVFGCRWMDGCGADICYHARDSADFIGKRLSQVATTKRRLYRGWAKNRTVSES